jgi:3-dehydroquinate synthase
MPTTTLGQGDAGVGVKNGINTFGKKNFTGAFAVPAAVVNDLALLASLDARGLRDGLVEAVKVSLLKDPVFFANLEKESVLLAAGNIPAIGRAVRRSAELHAKHIAGNGDPFELGSARPLDLGHWAAHKLESMTNHRLTHGEAVAVGLALDLICARELGLFGQAETERSLNLLVALGFKIYAPEMHLDGGAPMLAGLEEFREHLGGQLTLVLPTAIGKSTQVHEMASAVVRKAADELKARDQQPCVVRS